MRAILSVMLAVLLVTSSSGCGLFGSVSPDEAAMEFLAAVGRGDTERAAQLTDAPPSAKTALDQARSALEPTSASAEIGEVQEPGGAAGAKVSYRLTWQLPHDRTWTYSSAMELDPAEDGWTVRWEPSVLHPSLGAGHTIALREVAPELAPVLGRDDRKLLAPENVVSILLYPAEATSDGGLTSVAGSLAGALGQFDDSITEKSIVEGTEKVKKKDGHYLVAALRESDYLTVKPEIYALPGVRFTQRERLLAPTPDFGLHVLRGIRSLVEEQVAGRAGWRIVGVDPSGAETAVLHDQPAEPSDAVSTTLSYRAQESAERAVDEVDEPAAMVALQASTGDILAVAQNAGADEQGPIALTGRYPPGSTFKIATALAGLSAGKVKPETTVDCPGTTTIGGRVIPNDDRFELGKVPFSTAFARSCNTTFAWLATELPAGALTAAAGDLGIGADFEIPGITTITGSAPPADNVVGQAANGFGQGTVLASPFGMALAAATVVTGRTPTPRILSDQRVKATRLGRPLPASQAEALRSMMRKVVTEGSAGTLASLRDVHGKTGTAQFGDGTNSHGWFVGFQGDLAFAVLLVGAGSSQPAVDATQRFLTGLD